MGSYKQYLAIMQNWLFDFIRECCKSIDIPSEFSTCFIYCLIEISYKFKIDLYFNTKEGVWSSFHDCSRCDGSPTKLLQIKSEQNRKNIKTLSLSHSMSAPLQSLIDIKATAQTRGNTKYIKEVCIGPMHRIIVK